MLCWFTPNKIPYGNRSYNESHKLLTTSIQDPSTFCKDQTGELNGECDRHHHSCNHIFETNVRPFSAYYTKKKSLYKLRKLILYTHGLVSSVKHCSFWSCYFQAQNPSIISYAYGINSNFLVWHSRSFKIWSIEALQRKKYLNSCIHIPLSVVSVSLLLWFPQPLIFSLPAFPLKIYPILQGLLKCYLCHEV